MADLAGKTLGNYRILEQIGQGGMASVFKAYQPSLERYVAIKVIHEALAAEDEQFSKRFQREAKAVAALRHPNIVQVFDFGTAGGVSYMVMEYLEGTTLKAELKMFSDTGHIMPLDDAQRIFQCVASAVDYAAGQGMVHRDLKPANVMLTTKGDVILTDFGIARIAGGTQYTSTGAVMGTPAYMSPEQGQGERGDGRSDIYSLGVILYELVTGRVPFEADTPLAVIFKHIRDPLPLPRRINPAVPESVEQVILKALAKSPNDRYQRAADMARALTEAMATAATRAPRQATTRVAKPLPPRSSPAETAILAGARPTLARSAIPRPTWVLGGLALGVLLVAGFLNLRKPSGPAVAVALSTPAPTATRTRVPPTPTSVYAEAGEISVQLGATNVEQGLVQFDFADGLTKPTYLLGVSARQTVTNGAPSRYVYFRVDDGFISARETEVWVQVQYFDRGTGTLFLNYDSTDPTAPNGAIWKESRQLIELTNSGQWRSATFVLPDAYFGGRQHNGADFRLGTGDIDLYIQSVKVVKPPAAYLIRIRIATTSDWIWLSLADGADWTNATLISASANADMSLTGPEEASIRLAQPLERARAGGQVEVVVDVLLADVTELTPLTFKIEGGALGSTKIELFSYLGAEPIPVNTIERRGQSMPYQQSIPAAGFLKPPP